MVNKLFYFQSNYFYNLIPVTESPTNITVDSSTTDGLLVSWTAPAIPVSGYEVFYVTTAGETHSAGNTTDTNLTVSDLSEVCSVFVVGYGGLFTTLPGARSSVIYLNSESSVFLFQFSQLLIQI